MEITIPVEALAAVLALQRGEATLGDGQLRLKKIAVGAGTATEKDSGWDLPATAEIRDVEVNVLTAEVTGTTKTLDVGLLTGASGADPDGFIDGIDISSTGRKRPGVAFNSGSDYFTTNKRGVLLSNFTAGTNADDRGLYYEKPFQADSVTAKRVSYSRGSTLTEFVGEIWFWYIDYAAVVTE